MEELVEEEAGLRPEIFASARAVVPSAGALAPRGEMRVLAGAPPRGCAGRVPLVVERGGMDTHAASRRVVVDSCLMSPQAADSCHHRRRLLTAVLTRRDGGYN